MAPYDEDEDEDEDSKSSGGQGGALQFHDFVFPAERKLSATEERQKLAEHKEKNSLLVEEQKDERQKRGEQKPEKALGSDYGVSQQATNGFEPHPILSQVAEFDGVDPNMNMDVEKNESKKTEELTYQHQLRLQNQNQPRFIPPTPRPSG